MKKNKTARGVSLVLRGLPAAAMACAAVLVYLFRASLTPAALLALSPKNALAAMGFLLGLYLLKSLSVLLPVLALYLLGGLLFSPAGALAANLLGAAAGLSLSYWLGRWCGAPLVDALRHKYATVAQADVFLQKNSWFCAFFLRVVGVLPMDVVSLYLGASRLPFGPYLLGGLGGMLPGVVMGTFIGENLGDPTSPAFLASVACSVLLSAVSALWYRRFCRRQGGS